MDFEGSCEKHGLSFFSSKKLRTGERSELIRTKRGVVERSGTKCLRGINKDYYEGET